MQHSIALALGAASVFLSAPTLAADAAAGKEAFHQQCALCHTAEPGDSGGAQGPSLQGIFGRRAAGDPAFSYSAALRRSKLTWDARTLDRFLKSPTTVVPGSSMVVSVPREDDRESLIAYFQSVARTGSTSDSLAARPSPAKDDWKNYAPGRSYHIRVAGLPQPYATDAARNRARHIERPADAKLAVPDGFKVAVFARGLTGPRALVTAPNGDIFVSETSAGRISVLRPSADGASVRQVETFAREMSQPFGLAFYPGGASPQWLYVGEVNRVVRYAYRNGDTKSRGEPEVVLARIAPTVGGHTTRGLAFSNDGRRLFISVGSQSNVAEDMPKKSARQIKAWEATHAVGAAWGDETNRAAVLEHDMQTGRTALFATGIRNCVGLTVQPATDALWCATNERDRLGDDLVPDYATRVKHGGFYGWPWYYIGSHEDPRLKGERPDLAGKVTVPDVLLGAHSAALGITFYTATSGASVFPEEYRGDAFVSLHGSWNRSTRTGHKLVRLRMKDNVPTGQYEDFLTGFIVSDDSAWGRPVATTVAADGSLLMSDDAGDTIYRISYSK